MRTALHRLRTARHCLSSTPPPACYIESIRQPAKQRRVDLGGTLLTNGDGLLVRGKVLYAVQNQQNQVAVIRLNASGTRGQLIDTLKSKDFDVPTTVTASGRALSAQHPIHDATDSDYRVLDHSHRSLLTSASRIASPSSETNSLGAWGYCPWVAQ